MRLLIPKFNIQVNQLHDEILIAIPDLKGELGTDGIFRDPKLSVQHNEQTIWLDFPGDYEMSVRGVIQSHVPKPKKDFKEILRVAKDKVKLRLGLDDDEFSVLFNQ